MVFLILHGIENHRPPGHWQFQLAAQLAGRGADVRYPALPDPDAPRLDCWLAALDGELAGTDGRERVVVCHSLACLLWFRAAEREGNAGIDRLLLVAPPATERVPAAGASFCRDPFDAARVRASVSGEIAIVCSDGDPYNPAGAQALYGDALGVTARVLPGAGHITPGRGYGDWPFALEWCLTAGG